MRTLNNIVIIWLHDNIIIQADDNINYYQKGFALLRMSKIFRATVPQQVGLARFSTYLIKLMKGYVLDY